MLKERAKQERWAGKLILDAGDVFTTGTRRQGKTRDVELATARFIVDQFNASGVAAIAIGDRDLSLGLKTLASLRRRAKFPFLSANLVDPTSKKLLFEDRRVIVVAGVKFGIFGVLSKSVSRGPAAARQFLILDPVPAAREQVKALRRQGADVIVALTHLRDTEQQALAKAVPEIDVILGGASLKMARHPERVGKTSIADAYLKGKYVSVLALHVQRGQKFPTTFVDRFKKQGLETKIKTLAGRIKTYERLLTSQKKRAETAGAAGAGKGRSLASTVRYYERQLVKLKSDKQLAELELSEAKAPDLKASFISYELVPLGRGVTDDPEVEKAVVAFRKKYPKPKPAARNRPAPTRSIFPTRSTGPTKKTTGR